MIEPFRSKSARQQHYYNYDRKQADYAAGRISPVSAVTPERYDTEQREHKDNQQ
jgi:hypothetical protein